jgi:transcription elongation factor Elf1
MTEPKATEKRGLECPRCGCGHFRVVYTRPKVRAILRIRECRYCGRRILTREQQLSAPPDVPHL